MMNSSAQWTELELGREETCSESGSDRSLSDCESSDAESWGQRSVVKRLLVVGGTLAFALVVVFGCARSISASAGTASQQSALSTSSTSAQTLLTIAKQAPSKPRETLTIVTPVGDGVPIKADAFASPEAPEPLPVAQLAVNKRRRPASLKPKEDLHDGDVCDEAEELYAGLCYTKCSILTGFPKARRSTAFSCCPTSDCHGNLFKMQTASLLPCQGYDVSSSDKGKACPHIRGECLEDEEQFGGECFEKCSLLTHGKFPHRIAAATCCNPEGLGGCWNFGNDDTNAKLNAGGGKGDGDASTPRASHFPLKYLTEKN